jgi:hypothetical protein
MIRGKRRQNRKSGFRTMSQVEALADVQRRMANGEQVGGSITVGEYGKSCLSAKETAGRKRSTLAQYAVDQELDHAALIRADEPRTPMRSTEVLGKLTWSSIA